jgi:tRNA U34 2-thiouridine synthase MnmA/TrmU
MDNGCKPKALLLLSGGLDSMLAGKILIDQGVDVLALSYKSYFFDDARAKKSAEILGIKIRTIDFSLEQLEIVKNPKFGRGGAMNPCIDCHALMLSYAKKIMEEEGYDFIATGEVIGQRPMSQNHKALDLIERKTGLIGLIFRPLSARKLPTTLPEKRGLIKSEYGIIGRGRTEQYAMAQKFGLKDFPSPGGGCLLTEKEFSQKLENILKLKDDFDSRDAELIQKGRHFLIDDYLYIVARNKDDCDFLSATRKNDELLVEIKNYSGASVLIKDLICEGIDKDNIKIAKDLAIKYSKNLIDKKDIEFNIYKPMKKNLDQVVFEKLNQFVEKNKIIDNLTVFFGHYSGFILAGILLYLLFTDYAHNYDMVAKAMTAGILSRFIFAVFIHKFFPKKRPFIENPVKLLLHPKFTSSFPSGHASFFFAVSMVVYFFNPMLGKIFFLISSLMGVSRVIGGVHWPVDVVFGAILGTFCGWLIAW